MDKIRAETYSAGRGAGRSWLGQAIVTLLAVAIAAAAAVVFLVAVGLVDSARIIPNPDLRAALLGFADSGTALSRVAVAAGAAVVGLISLALARGRLFPGAPAAPAARHIVSADDKGVVMVTTAGIATVAESAALRAPGVVRAHARVSGRGSAPVRLHIRVQCFGSADLKRAGREARELASDAVQRLVGIDVTDTNVELIVIPPEEAARVLE